MLRVGLVALPGGGRCGGFPDAFGPLQALERDTDVLDVDAEGLGGLAGCALLVDDDAFDRIEFVRGQHGAGQLEAVGEAAAGGDQVASGSSIR